MATQLSTQPNLCGQCHHLRKRLPTLSWQCHHLMEPLIPFSVVMRLLRLLPVVIATTYRGRSASSQWSVSPPAKVVQIALSNQCHHQWRLLSPPSVVIATVSSGHSSNCKLPVPAPAEKLNPLALASANTCRCHKANSPLTVSPPSKATQFTLSCLCHHLRKWLSLLSMVRETTFGGC